MPLKAVTARSLPDQVFRQVASAILDGTYKPGDALPPERELSEIFGVNRHAVREAIKRAEQIGLVRSKQGGGTIVLDFEKTAGLDALALLAEYAAEDLTGARLWRAGFEMRAAIGTDLARLCALRADAKTKRDLVEIAHQLKQAPHDAGIVALDLRFWERMLDGADNIAYRLAYNSLIRSAQHAPELQLGWTIKELESSDFRISIAEAIAAGDSAAAEAAARTSLRGAIAAVDAAIAHLEQEKKETA
ncbi:MAG: FadR/GntR family transcriptional regulator [Solirubrobacterales bacterium]